MSTSTIDASAVRAWFEDESLWIELIDGRTFSTPLVKFPRLLHATAEQRAAVELSGDGRGLHWDELDEDISVEGIMLGRGDNTRFGREHRVETCEICGLRQGSLASENWADQVPSSHRDQPNGPTV